MVRYRYVDDPATHGWTTIRHIIAHFDRDKPQIIDAIEAGAIFPREGLQAIHRAHFAAYVAHRLCIGQRRQRAVEDWVKECDTKYPDIFDPLFPRRRT
jgi:hypothetical protein